MYNSILQKIKSSKKMIKNNIFLFKGMYFCYGLWLFSPVAIIYFKQVTGSYALGMLVFSLISICQCLFEIPCGMLSDRFSRKTNLVIGNICLVINMFLWAYAGIIQSSSCLFLGSFFRGLGFALRSGPITAMIYETMSDLRKGKLFSTILAKIHSYYYLGNIISAFFSALIIYYSSIETLVFLSIIPFAISLIFSCFLINPKNNFDSYLSVGKQVKRSWTFFIKNKKLRSFAVLQILRSSLITSIFRFEVSYYETLLSLYLVNFARGIQNVIAWISYHFIHIFQKYSPIKTIYISMWGNALIRLIALFFNNALTPFLSAFQNIFYGSTSIASNTLLQKEYHKSLRATMDSMVEFANGICLSIIGFLIGLISEYISLQVILILAALIHLLLAYFYKKIENKYSAKW